ncbi:MULTISPECIES: EamA family transporter [Chryseobacterium]|uniref:DMT family transporter n=2 Tax=Chryseobacterium TaxID=59732 RepID=A0AAE3YBY1_9FLAO|nr:MULTISPECIES: DMT family transporter [Chryseobacterium]MBL3548111.1 DMT family transporter [Chryseobacterium sp. KMC2]MDR6527504.1 inner membrane transporter RhtA [Chryseobacterium rhizosphaerae]MDR6547555.1 inner membrane transporter RhtA [Chryseobacterium rhizosphaerae]REC76688.1 DMT family transporter [Chryseobacterium rhizosphaerae]SMC49571.1 inner membrane transporter RhtA [Chryseobacterium sp. YR221]
MKKSNVAIPATLLAIICVQGGASIAKQLFPAIGAIGTVSLRIVLSAVLLTLINRPKFLQFTKQKWKYCALYGIGLAAMNLIFYMAIQRIPLGLAVTVEFAGPLFLALALSRKLLDVVWALLACVGILLIVPWQSNNIDLLGLGLAFLAGMFWAGYIVMGGKVAKIMDGKDAVTTGMLFASLVIIPFTIWDGAVFNLTPTLFIKGLGVAILSSALPFSLEMMALKKLPAKTFSILMSLEPAFAAFSGLLFLSESLTFLQWISIACVIAASIGTTVFSKTSVE